MLAHCTNVAHVLSNDVHVWIFDLNLYVGRKSDVL